jgi:hypothetical protein
MPLKRRYGYMQRLAAAFHLLPVSGLLIVPPKIMTLLSFLTSVLLFYFGTVTVATLMAGTLTGIGVVFVGNPVMTLLSTPIFIGLWTTVHMILTVSKKKGAKTLLFVALALIVLTPAFTFCLASGVFDSLKLSNDSYIDLHNCTVFLNVQNVGVKDVVITNVTVGNLVWAFSSLNSAPDTLERLPRGENITLSLVYAHLGYELYWANINYDGPYCLNGGAVEPTTFQDGKTYSVKIQTDGPTFMFQVKAEYLTREDIQRIQADAYNIYNLTEGNETYCLFWISIQFYALSWWSRIFVHSFTVGPLTFTFDRPILVKNDFWPDIKYADVDIALQPAVAVAKYRQTSIPGQLYAVVQAVEPDVEIAPATANQPLASPPFSLGNTYSLTVFTMENNYTTTVTVQEK